MTGKALQDMGTAGYGRFYKPAVNAPGLVLIGLDLARGDDGCALAAWRGGCGAAVKRGDTAGFTAGVAGNPP